jgi:hypothetical protein
LRRILLALTLVAALLLPGAPAPADAATFTFTINAPLFILIDGPLGNPTGVACLGAAGAHPWLGVRVTGQNPQTVDGFIGTSANQFNDDTGKHKASAKDTSSSTSSIDIRAFTEIQGQNGDPNTGTLANVKAKMSTKIKKYVVDPQNESDLAGTSGTLKVSSKGTPGLTVAADGIAAKLTTSGSCQLNFDQTNRPVSLTVSGTTQDGHPINIKVGR